MDEATLKAYVNAVHVAEVLDEPNWEEAPSPDLLNQQTAKLDMRHQVSLNLGTVSLEFCLLGHSDHHMILSNIDPRQSPFTLLFQIALKLLTCKKRQATQLWLMSSWLNDPKIRTLWNKSRPDKSGWLSELHQVLGLE